MSLLQLTVNKSFSRCRNELYSNTKESPSQPSVGGLAETNSQEH